MRLMNSLLMVIMALVVNYQAQPQPQRYHRNQPQQPQQQPQPQQPQQQPQPQQPQQQQQPQLQPPQQSQYQPQQQQPQPQPPQQQPQYQPQQQQPQPQPPQQQPQYQPQPQLTTPPPQQPQSQPATPSQIPSSPYPLQSSSSVENYNGNKGTNPTSNSINGNNNSYQSSNSTANGNGCQLPNDANIVPITPDQSNRGWAMSPDQTCTPGSWCPYACRPGMYSPQWDPTSRCPAGAGCKTMHGGLQCKPDGTLEIPFPDRPLCINGLGNVHIQSKLEDPVSFCQTVYPGNEAMLIPTVANPHTDSQTLNSPPSSYWLGTTAQYYVNPPASTAAQCIWGDPSQGPIGNWAPYVVGVGQSPSGVTYASLTPNPNYPAVQTHSNFSTYKITLTCSDCPPSFTNPKCQLDYQTNTLHPCTVGIPSGSTARILLG